MTTVVNIRHKGAVWDIYIGRPGKGQPGPLGNPIAPGRTCIWCGRRHGRDAALLACYRGWLEATVEDDPGYRAMVRACHGKRLGCFCVRKDGTGLCHGHVLAEVAAKLASEPEPTPRRQRPLARRREPQMSIGERLARGEDRIKELAPVEPCERIPVELGPRVPGDAAWYRVGRGLTTCPHRAYRWAQSSGQEVELLDERRQVVDGA